jgi:hypothetical protein
LNTATTASNYKQPDDSTPKAANPQVGIVTLFHNALGVGPTPASKFIEPVSSKDDPGNVIRKNG